MQGKTISAVIRVNSREALLKRNLRRHLKQLGFSRASNGDLLAPGSTKSVIRDLHQPQRLEILNAQTRFVERAFPKLQKYFASGVDVDVEKIRPRLERVKTHSWQGDLFRLASLTWSVPVSSGFGRRLRFLVWDDHNGKLIGIFAIGDPVFNLSVRDEFVGWTGVDRSERLVNVLDAYVLGSIPPYNSLLGGKLVACLIRSVDVYNEFQKQYGETTGIISKRTKLPNLLAVTTSSSMGRSSLYNRLKLDEQHYFRSIGYSGGWGHFHVPETLFEQMRDYLRDSGHAYADLHGFGQGPNWRIRVLRAALALLGFKGDLLRHGIKRQVFISIFATNALEILRGSDERPNLTGLQSVDEIARLAINRWMIPRARSREEYLKWSSGDMLALIMGTHREAQSLASIKTA